MTATVEGLHLGTARAASASTGRSRDAGALPVEGALPAELTGVYLRACPYPVRGGGPGHPGVARGPYVVSGLRLGHGGAWWYRTPARPDDRHGPLGPIPALAPTVWPADPGRPQDRPGAGVTIARPIRETSGTWHTVASYPGLDYAEYLVAGPDGKVAHAEPFVLAGAPLMRAVGLCTRYVVVFDLPVTYHRAAAAVGRRFPYLWRPDRAARIGLLARGAAGGDGADGGDLGAAGDGAGRGAGAPPRWFTVAPCYVTDAVNAYTERGRVVVDGVWRPRAFDSTGESAERTASPETAASAESAAASRVQRWVLDPATGEVRERSLIGSLRGALVDERVRGRRHRYVFGVSGGAAGPELSCHDLDRGTVQAYALGAGWRVEQPVFVPRPGGPESRPDGRRDVEGDGWIVALASDVVHRRGLLLVLDALGVAGGPRAVVRIPFSPPVAQRAVWLPAAGGNDGADGHRA